MKKKVLAVITLVFLLGTAVISYGQTNQKSIYNDVKTTNWAYDAISSMSDRGIISGYPDGSFKPNNEVTYGEFIKLVATGCLNEADAGNSDSGNWALNYYNQLQAHDLFTVNEIPQSKLNMPIPRKDMALIVAGIFSDNYEKYYDAILKDLSDLDKASASCENILKCYARGIITGYPDGTFRPDGTLTRAESIIVIKRALENDSRVMPEVVAADAITEHLQNDTVTFADAETTFGEFYGVDTAQELKEKDAMSYYSMLTKDGKKDIHEAAKNIDVSRDGGLVYCQYYKIVEAADIGITSIKKIYNSYGDEGFEVAPGNQNLCAVLIKDNEISCVLSDGGGLDGRPRIFWAPGSADLPDFDYIGFEGGNTLFLVNNPWK